MVKNTNNASSTIGGVRHKIAQAPCPASLFRRVMISRSLQRWPNSTRGCGIAGNLRIPSRNTAEATRTRQRLGVLITSNNPFHWLYDYWMAVKWGWHQGPKYVRHRAGTATFRYQADRSRYQPPRPGPSIIATGVNAHSISAIPGRHECFLQEITQRQSSGTRDACRLAARTEPPETRRRYLLQAGLGQTQFTRTAPWYSSV